MASISSESTSSAWQRAGLGVWHNGERLAFHGEGLFGLGDAPSTDDKIFRVC